MPDIKQYDWDELKPKTPKPKPKDKSIFKTHKVKAKDYSIFDEQYAHLQHLRNIAKED